MVQQIVVHPYGGILLGNKKAQTCYMQQFGEVSRKLWVKKKPIQKGYTLHDSIYITIWNGKILEMENRWMVSTS